MKKSAVAMLLAAMLGGCSMNASNKPIHVVVDNEVRTRSVDQAYQQREQPLQAAMGPTIATFGRPVREMSSQVEIALKDRGIKRLPIAITAFVDLNDPTQKRKLGTELAEGFFHELQVRGFNVVDYRALPFAGDKADSMTNLADFYRQYRISYVLTGTYTVTPDGALLNARVLDTVTKQVVATGQSILSTADLEGGLPGYNPLQSRDGMIIENGGVPVN